MVQLKKARRALPKSVRFKSYFIKYERGALQTKKIHIEKDSVQETLIIPLYGRKMCAEKFPTLYTDTTAQTLCESLDYDFSPLEAKKDTLFHEFGALEAAMRQLDMAWEINDYLKLHPKAVIVNLGCGLDNTGRACDNGTCKIVNVDLPDVIAVRERLMPAEEREKNITADIKDCEWMNEVDGTNGVIFFAAGVFHYFETEKVKDLVLRLSKRYPGGRLIFDAVGKRGLKMMKRTVLKNMGMKDIDVLFCVNDPEQDLNWSDKITVTSKGYMLGYYDMKTKGIRWTHRLLAKMGDRWLKMTVYRMDF
ncbi:MULTISPECIES: class I SAM-dependent methyltransferase [Jonquetella]|uniref:class I SAM-dependent methyltransferase n=1 Tax=Jonquetella TaxID=428711 RepID=UPI001E32A19B|nr:MULTISPECIES: class I SAM-dependent methyltransferase [Jonquetella]